MTRPNRISPTAVVFTAYPNAFRNIANAIVRIKSISHPEGELRNRRVRYVLERIAERMTQEYARVEQHHQEAQRRRRHHSQSSSATSKDATLDDIFGEVEILEDRSEGEGEEIHPIRASSLSFILVDDDSNIRTRIFPRSFHCQACGHFAAINAEHPPASLVCPCCQQAYLVQEPIVFMCARCANVRELAPKGDQIKQDVRRLRRLESFLGGPPDCPDCNNGHIHLEKHDTNSIQQWEWYCTNCSAFDEIVQEQCLECYMPRGQDQSTPPSMIFMNAFPAAAPSALRPLIDVQMFIRDVPLDPESILATARETGQDWPDYYEVQGSNSNLDNGQLERVATACISNAYLLDRIGVVTSVYGYRAGGIANHPITPVGEDDRLAKFFSDPDGFTQYICYGMINEGAALLLELDKPLIMDRLSRIDPALRALSYDQLVRRNRLTLNGMPLGDILKPEGYDRQFLLFRSLHAMEHALLTSAIQRIGNEVLGSILFLDAGVLVIYEREPIGRGGVVQVVNRGPGLIALLDAAADLVVGCAQGCADGCPACIYVRDSHCQYRYEDWGRTWIPSNTLLSRTGARNILVPELFM